MKHKFLLQFLITFLFSQIQCNPRKSVSDEVDFHSFADYPPADPPHSDENSDFWYESAQNSLNGKLKSRSYMIEKEAKNVIFYLGDGMGVSTVTAARIFKGQQENSKYGGEEAELYMDTFPFLGASKTFCTDKTVADSACSATAYLCGTKANERTMGVSPAVLHKNCTAQMEKANQVSSILAFAQAAGKSTGIITTTRVTHASPGAAYVHIASRDWESDADILNSGENPNECDDIALQLTTQNPGQNINVILGGGRKSFRPNRMNDTEAGRPFMRRDGRDLIEEWEGWRKSRDESYAYVETYEDFKKVDPSKTDYLFGVFAYDDLNWVSERHKENDPLLFEMVEMAIKILERNPKGFFLFVEGGKIDSGHHANKARRAMEETIEFDESIKKGDEMTIDDETLIIVTADHSHVFTIGGYPNRGNALFAPTNERTAMDGLPYTMLGYNNGPGYRQYEVFNETLCRRYDISQDDYNSSDYTQNPAMELDSETHAGEDVFVFAKGPFAHLLTGINQQSFIPHVMAYASCVGPWVKYCDEIKDDNSGFMIKYSSVLILTLQIYLMYLFNLLFRSQ